MSTGVTRRQILDLQTMTDAEFANVLILMGSVSFGSAGIATSFFQRFAAAKAAQYLSASAIRSALVKVIRSLFIGAVGGITAYGIEGKAAKEAILIEIENATGLVLDDLDVESAKRAVGKLFADKINLQYGTNFSPFYPPENIVGEIKTQLISELLSSVAASAPPPSAFKFLDNAVAVDITNQIINRYRLIHGLPTVASGVVLTPTVKRVQNKIRQATFRQGHTRFSEWRNQDNDLIVNAYQAKLQALRVAKKAYRTAFANVTRLTRIKARYVTLGDTVAANATQTLINAAIIVKDAKHAIFIAAQSLTYTGDGTTL